MNSGAFDDRDNARRHVKLWMQENLPGDYTVGNLMGLARKIVADDLEPVDDIRVQWAETSYGILRGIVEFAADQIGKEQSCSTHDAHSSMQAADDRIARAAALAWEAAAALPYRAAAARCKLLNALELLGSTQLGDHNRSSHFARAQQAISLALLMLGTPSGRSVAV